MIHVGTFHGYIGFEGDRKVMNGAIEAWLKSFDGVVEIISHQITNVGMASYVCAQIIVRVS